ncbi:GyrI-like domain-containing protein [Staphylococcus caprae]|uniref:GyrI-like domain-containing protein n=1 Tax=Staphylococcus TaxID=1279 RepID=UPI0008AA295F|nr:GyrI-like domain-containing protein [Staphylococcus sp. HMSC62A08]OHS41390.1 transcriptional regulator [Staphylococcus sp. HMSC62A08]
MDYNIKNLEKTRFIGVYRHYKSGGHAQSNIADFWEDVHSMKLDERLIEKSDKQLNGLLGVCIPHQDKTMDYAIGVTSTDDPHDGLDTFYLEGGKYLVVEAKGPVPKSVQQTMNHIHRELIPNENIEVKQAPFFELYREGDTESDNYITEIWMPIH